MATELSSLQCNVSRSDVGHFLPWSIKNLHTCSSILSPSIWLVVDDDEVFRHEEATNGRGWGESSSLNLSTLSESLHKKNTIFYGVETFPI